MARHSFRPGALLGIAILAIAPAAAAAQGTGMTIDQAIALALRGADAIRLRELALQKARLAVDEATARALPQVGLQASVSYLVNPPQGYTVTAGQLGSFTPTIPANTVKPGPAIPLGTFSIPEKDFNIGAQEHNYFSLSASLMQPLFTWGKIRGAIDLAALQADSAGNDLAAQRRDIQREVSRAWDGALLAAGSMEVLKRLKETAAEVVNDRQKAFDDGTTNREAVLQAQSDLAQIASKLVDAEQARLTSLESLGILTGLDPSTIVLASGFHDSLPPLDETAIRAAVLKSSTDLAASRTRVQQAGKKLVVEKGGALLLPDVSLGVTLDVTGQEDVPYKDWSWDASMWNWDLVISLGVKTTVFDGLAARSRIAQAQKDADMAGTARAQQEKLVGLSVRQDMDAALRADAAVQEKQAAWDDAQERLRNAQSSFDSGLVSRADLRGAQILEGTAALDLLAARYTREEALADITRLTGETP
jgi:outer membrane protein TolC